MPILAVGVKKASQYFEQTREDLGATWPHKNCWEETFQRHYLPTLPAYKRNLCLQAAHTCTSQCDHKPFPSLMWRASKDKEAQLLLLVPVLCCTISKQVNKWRITTPPILKVYQEEHRADKPKNLRHPVLFGKVMKVKKGEVRHLHGHSKTAWAVMRSFINSRSPHYVRLIWL